MGWSCSVNLYVPRTNVSTALRAVSKLVEPGSTGSCEVRLPDGTVLLLPFGRSELTPSAPRDLGAEPVRLDLVLKVPADEVTEDWWDEEPYTDDGGQFVGVGIIRLWITLGTRYAELRFHGPSGDVSTILRDSPAVHDQLLGVLHAAEGGAGAIIDDDGTAKLLSDPTTELQIDWKLVDRGDGAPDSDRLAEEVLRHSG